MKMLSDRKNRHSPCSCRRRVASGGFTLIELMLACSLFVIATAGIASVHVITNTMLKAAVASGNLQRDAQVLNGRMVQWLRPGTGAQILSGGDGIQIETVTSVSPVQSVFSRISFNNLTDQISYDNDINDAAAAVVVAARVYKIAGGNIFTKSGDLIEVNFGLDSDYRYGPVRPAELSFKVKMRGAQ